jgi:predicted flap endonuclease-1-like 5' DNA nuclease
MTQNNSPNGITACVIVCWLLAFASGVFIAAALIGWAELHGLVAAVIGLIVILIAGWLLKGMFCNDDVPASAVASTAAVAVSADAVAVSGVEKPAAKAEPKKPAAKKTAAKSATTSKTKTAVAKKPATKKVAAPKAKPAPKKIVAKKPVAKKPVVTKYYKKAPAKVDDLKLISGVGPKLESTLNEIGIYQFAQVAVWKKADIKEVDDQLKFKGRIARDDWMSQAKTLAKSGDTDFSKKKRKT